MGEVGIGLKGGQEEEAEKPERRKKEKIKKEEAEKPEMGRWKVWGGEDDGSGM